MTRAAGTDIKGVAAIGECMVELIEEDDGRMRRGFGGDTLNTSVYLARLGVPTAYVTALGDDPYSAEMLGAWQEEGIVTEFVSRKPGALPGLYAIRTDANGERSFAYWRWSAPVRTMIREGALDRLAQRLDDFACLYLSGITLSLFDDAQRERLFELMQQARARGLSVAFDTNHRPRCWDSADTARAAYDRMAGIADLVLPSFEDCQAVYGDADSRATADRFAAAGVETAVIKQGAEGAGILDRGHWQQVPTEAVATPVDTSAAGDSFNAGFLAAWLRGRPAATAAAIGNAVAGRVVQYRGTIIPREALSDLDETGEHADTPIAKEPRT